MTKKKRWTLALLECSNFATTTDNPIQETSAPFIVILCWLGLQVRHNVHNLREAAAPLTFDHREPGRQIHCHVFQ